MNVAKLIVQPQSVAGSLLGNTICNPVQDSESEWVVSLLEATYLPIEDFSVKTWLPVDEESIEKMNQTIKK